MSKRRNKPVTTPAVEVPADINAQLAAVSAEIAGDEKPATPAPAKPAKAQPAGNPLTALENGLIAEVSFVTDMAYRAEKHTEFRAATFAPVYTFVRKERSITDLMAQSFVAELAIDEKDTPDVVTSMKRVRRNIKQAFDAALKPNGLTLAWQFVDKDGKPNRQGRLVGAEIVEREEPAIVPFDTIAKDAASKAVAKVPAAPSDEAVTVTEQAILDTADMIESGEVAAESQDSFESTVYDAGIAALASGLDPADVLAALSIVSNRLKTAIQDQSSRAMLQAKADAAAEKAQAKQDKADAKALAEASEDNPELINF